MTPGRLDIEVPRNGSDARTLQLLTRDPATGGEVPYDLSDTLVIARARNVFGGGVISSASVTISDAAEGKIDVIWLGSQFDGYGNAFQTALAAYDIRLVGADGIPVIPIRGTIYISPEASS